MEQKRKRLNGFDIAVMAVILLGAAIWLFINLVPTQTGEAVLAEGQATYFIQVMNLTPAQAEQVQVGDRLLEAGRNIPIGEVVEIETRPHMISVADSEARLVRWEPVEGRVDIILSVEAEVEVTERDILVEGQFAIKGGRIFSFTGPGYGFASAAILGLEERGGLTE